MLIATLAASLSLLAAAESGSDTNSAIERFFIGTTEGSGTADIIMSGKHTVRDRSVGRKDASGALLLDQTVEEQGKPARRRSWRLVRSGDNRITGTINDVKGAVTGNVTGNVLHLRYKMLDGPTVEQWITLQADGRTAKNRMVYRRIGVKVATVETVIRRVE